MKTSLVFINVFKEHPVKQKIFVNTLTALAVLIGTQSVWSADTATDAARTIEISATLASIYLSGSTITTILERNKNMTVLLQEFPWSQYCEEKGRLEGHQEGRQQGKEEGKNEGRMEALVTVARARHGELNEQLAVAITRSPRELKEITDMILNASNQAELEHMLEN